MINLIHFTFEGIIIWKLIISYQIIEGNIPWFMKMDYTFLSLNLVHIIILILCTIVFFYESGIYIKISTTCSLHSFNNIEIEDYKLPDNFSHWKEKERKKYILYKSNEFKYHHNYEDLRNLHSLISLERKKKKFIYF